MCIQAVTAQQLQFSKTNNLLLLLRTLYIKLACIVTQVTMTPGRALTTRHVMFSRQLRSNQQRLQIVYMWASLMMT